MSQNERIIAIEEHFISPMLAERYTGHHKLSSFMHSTRRLENLGDARIREMDEAGIDVQVISHLQPVPQVFEPDMSVTLARQANNILHDGIAVHPDRFAGFAAEQDDRLAGAPDVHHLHAHASAMRSRPAGRRASRSPGR